MPRLVSFQVRIHTGFYCFVEIGQIFHNKYIFKNKIHFPSLNLGNILSEWLKNSGRGLNGVKIHKIEASALGLVLEVGPYLS